MQTTPSIDIRELGNARRLKAWLKAGKIVELRDGHGILGRIMPVKTEPLPLRPARPVRRKKFPNFAARAKKIFGDRVLPGSDIVIEERGRF